MIDITRSQDEVNADVLTTQVQGIQLANLQPYHKANASKELLNSASVTISGERTWRAQVTTAFAGRSYSGVPDTTGAVKIVIVRIVSGSPLYKLWNPNILLAAGTIINDTGSPIPLYSLVHIRVIGGWPTVTLANCTAGIDTSAFGNDTVNTYGPTDPTFSESAFLAEEDAAILTGGTGALLGPSE
jgi:hypothetical protein